MVIGKADIKGTPVQASLEAVPVSQGTLALLNPLVIGKPDIKGTPLRIGILGPGTKVEVEVQRSIQVPDSFHGAGCEQFSVCPDEVVFVAETEKPASFMAGLFNGHDPPWKQSRKMTRIPLTRLKFC